MQKKNEACSIYISIRSHHLRVVDFLLMVKNLIIKKPTTTSLITLSNPVINQHGKLASISKELSTKYLLLRLSILTC